MLWPRTATLRKQALCTSCAFLWLIDSAFIHRIFGDASRSVVFLTASISNTPGRLASPERPMAVTHTASKLARGNVCDNRSDENTSVVQPLSTLDCTTQNRTSSANDAFQLTITCVADFESAALTIGCAGAARSIHVNAGTSAGCRLISLRSREHSALLRAVCVSCSKGRNRPARSAFE